MKVVGKNIIARRGETFSLIRRVYKDDGITPYVLSKAIVNPYLIVTVSSSPYKLQGGYKCNWWIDLSTYPSFATTTPYLVDQSVIDGNQLPGGRTAEQSIYYTQDENGNKSFYYYDSETSSYKEYSFVFRKTFSHKETNEWIESLYTYQFRIVGGNRTKGVLQGLFKAIYPGVKVPEDNRTLYYQIKKCRADLVKNLRFSAPLATFFTEDVLQRPEKLIIKTNS